MSDHQRLINKFIADIPEGESLLYQLHFLISENDEAAVQMLQDNLNRIVNQKNCPDIEILEQKIILSRPKAGQLISEFGKYVYALTSTTQMPQNQQSKPDYLQEAMDEIDLFHYENALQSFKDFFEENHDANRFYAKRAEINLLLGRYPSVMSLATKGKVLELQFIASYAMADFEHCAELAVEFCSLITSRSLCFISLYEAIYITVFAMLASSSPSAVSATFKKIDNLLSASDTVHLAGIVDAFKARRFSEVISSLNNEFNDFYTASFYTHSILYSLIQAIECNVVACAVSPFSVIKLDRIAQISGISQTEMIPILSSVIRRGRIVGRIDFVDSIFKAEDYDQRQIQIEQMLGKVCAVRSKIEVAKWKSGLK